MRLAIIGFVAGLALLYGPTGAARIPYEEPGIRGAVVTWIGPSDRSQPNLELVFRQAGREVARTRTDARGLFAIELPAGRYDVDAEVPDRKKYLKAELFPAQVRVRPRFVGRVRFVWDIGIR
jgi:hypothetical protein